MRRRELVLGVLVVFALAVPTSASAYTGPGAGLTVIGAAIALVASIVLGIFGFFWYPIKRLIRTRSKKTEPPSDQVDP
jgi:hypothetical protein